MNRLTCLFALAALSAIASANDDSLVRHQYGEQAAAVNTGNAKRFFATIDPSFTQVEPNGRTMNFPQYKTGINRLLATFKSGTMKFRLGPIKYVGGKAIVDYDLEGDLNIGHGIKFHDVERGRDTWKKVGGKYVQVHEVIKLSKQTPLGNRASNSVSTL